MSSPAEHRAACAPAWQPVFPDEILEEIFLRLDAAEDLARASAACTTFHRVVSARRFLQRFRRLHLPPVLGVLQFGGPGTFHPAEPPHRSAAAARAFARDADFTFSFLGTREYWEVCDARDGRVLLYLVFKVNLMVCDPLHRRQVRLPPIPNDLAGFDLTPLAFSSATNGFDLRDFDAFLDPTNDGEKEKQDLSFRVMCIVKNQHNIVTFHFNSATGKWRSIMFNIPVPLGSHFSFLTFEPYYAHGCFFWTTGGISRFMFMLNMHDMKLSVVDLPPEENSQQAIVEAGEGKIALFNINADMLQLYYKSLQGTDWHHERTISLPKLNSYYWKINNAAAGYLLLQANYMFGQQEAQYFTLNLKTFLVERLCISSRHTFRACLYASFLLPFSKPSI